MAGNIVEYTLSLQDKISGKLSRIGIANDRQLAVWSRVQRQVVQTDHTMQDFGVSIGSCRAGVDTGRKHRSDTHHQPGNTIARKAVASFGEYDGRPFEGGFFRSIR